jgi:hypothetical protein
VSPVRKIRNIVRRSQVGKGRKYRSRSAPLDALKIGETVCFEAKGHIEYASVRGSAYGFAKSRGRRFVCNRLNPSLVIVRRMA